MHQLLAILFIWGITLQAAVRGITTTTDLAWLINEIGGNRVQVESLLRGTEDPHYVDTLPSYIQKAANASFVCFVGFDLEVGWLPKILSRSGNAGIQSGGRGYCEAGKSIQPLGRVVGKVDRSMGDIHPSGNPHFWLAPSYLMKAGEGVSEVLAGLDPNGADYFATRLQALQRRVSVHTKQLQKKLASYANQKNLVLEYHKEFVYFLKEYGLESFGAIEEKPGVAPSAGRIAKIAVAAKKAGVRIVLAADTAPKSVLERFQELSNIPVVYLPASQQPDQGMDSLFKHQDYLVDSILKVLNASRT